MISKNLYNNIGIEAVSIMLIVQQAQSMPMSKILLILPIVTHRELLDYLSKKNAKIQGMEKLIIEKTSCFSNFNKRFYDNLCGTINAIQFLNEIGAIKIDDGSVSVKSEIPFDSAMGKRAEKISKASFNIANVLSDSVEKLYLNLRIEL
jgi:hypothetical protein